MGTFEIEVGLCWTDGQWSTLGPFTLTAETANDAEVDAHRQAHEAAERTSPDGAELAHVFTYSLAVVDEEDVDS